MDILAFDLSKSNTGWARYCTGDARPSYGSVKLGTGWTDRIGMMRKLYMHLTDLSAFGEPDAVFYEGPLPGNAQSTEKNNRNANANCALVEFYYGSAKRIRVQEVHNLTWKRHFFDPNIPKRVKDEIGKSVRNPSYDPKALSLAACKALGLSPENHDEADALGILDYALMLEKITPPWRAELVLV